MYTQSPSPKLIIVMYLIAMCLMVGCAPPKTYQDLTATKTISIVVTPSLAVLAKPTSTPTKSMPTATSLPSPTPLATATLLPPIGKIAFVVDGENLYMINADGSGLTKLIGSPSAIIAGPFWSHNGQTIFFLSDLGSSHGILEIYSFNTTEDDLKRLTNDSFPDDDIAISPDGDLIAFISERHDREDVFLMSSDGDNLHQLTKGEPSHKSHPVWSPNGDRIAFLVGHENDNYNDLYMIGADGNRETRLTSELVARVAPAWSPDGSQIAVTINENGKNDIYLVKADGNGISQLTRNGTGGFSLVWSPDGKHITFETTEGIYMVRVSDGHQQELSTEPRIRNPISKEPIWSPDGTHIAFVSQRDGGSTERQELYVMNHDGSGVTRLTFNLGCCYLDSLSWYSP